MCLCRTEQQHMLSGSTRLEKRIQMLEGRLQQQPTSPQHMLGRENNKSPPGAFSQQGPSVHSNGEFQTEELQGVQYAGFVTPRTALPPTAQSSPSDGHEGAELEDFLLNDSNALLEGILDSTLLGPQSTAVDVTQLPEILLQALIDIFYSSYYFIFPIIPQDQFQQQYDRWLLAHRRTVNSPHEDIRSGFSFLLYALLAVAASAIPTDHAVFKHPGMEIYQLIQIGDLLYTHATSKCPGFPYQRDETHPINVAIAQGLLSLYLTVTGNLSDAWMVSGNAIRQYQALELEELENSTSGAPDVGETWNPRGNVWWCLYILDCSLSTALSKPLALYDAECDMGRCNEERCLELEANTDPWFSIIAEFHVTISRIYRSIRSIRKSHPSQAGKMWDTLRSYTKKYDTELENHYAKRVLPKIAESDGKVKRLALQAIAECSYFIGLVLLYRSFIEQFNAADPEAFLRCAEAASNCIKATPQLIATVPVSHFVVQQSRAVYASTKVLLHCMRLARNSSFNKRAWCDVQSGFEMLRKINIRWPQIQNYWRLTEEDMRQTQNEFNRHNLFHGVFDRYGQEFERSKRRRLSDDSFRHDSFSAGPSLPSESHNFSGGYQMNDDSFVLSDFHPLSLTSEEYSGKNFDDTMLILPIEFGDVTEIDDN
ncbi:hypothetical protein N7520_003569 [Penicillium odoratum]|uniref:uncharacterized protein n=1 Tax=Penicillium odoratum TaxID=1167516 RepID=UPI002546AB7B|nr:uncharacterized protein N7520_003569 [Penicillium odoratum]KAJ5769010.1 hypothetical protein N7520_003569 [Penicillium odoratum]